VAATWPIANDLDEDWPPRGGALGARLRALDIGAWPSKLASLVRPELRRDLHVKLVRTRSRLARTLMIFLRRTANRLEPYV
jgi:hypothetical protein